MSIERRQSGPKASVDEAIHGEAAAILGQYGQLDTNGRIPETLQKTIDTGACNASQLQYIGEAIEASRGHARMERSVFAAAAHMGFRNFRNANLQMAQLENVSFANVDLRDAQLQDAQFTRVNFAGTRFNGAQLDDADFDGSNLNTADLSSIWIENKQLDLTDQAIAMKGEDIWQIHTTSLDEVGTCNDCEILNGRVLNARNIQRYGRRAVAVFQEGHPLGYVKLKGDPSFLPMRTVRNREGETIFWKGMIYALSFSMASTLLSLSEPYRGEKSVWRKIDMEALATQEGKLEPVPHMTRNNIRFIGVPAIYEMLSELTRRIEEGEEPMVDMLSGERTGG